MVKGAIFGITVVTVVAVGSYAGQEGVLRLGWRSSNSLAKKGVGIKGKGGSREVEALHKYISVQFCD